MSEKKYLPIWTDGMNYDEQHLVYWISNNNERVDPIYSFLPIRMPGDLFCERKKFEYIHEICGFFEEGPARTYGEIVPLEYYVAEKAFDAAAREFFERYPEASEVTFGRLKYNGIYDTKFAMDYKKRLDLFRGILDRKIEENRIADEVFEYRKKVIQNGIHCPQYRIKARLDIREEDICYKFPEKITDCGFPYIPEKQVRVKKEDVYKYYLVIPENIFTAGNQYIRYKQNSEEYQDFFKAAEKGDFEEIKKWLASGTDINTIDKYGHTALFRLIRSQFNNEKGDIESIKELIASGGNPAIYGAGIGDSPLDEACMERNKDMLVFLLECKVSPHLYLYLDEPCEDMAETLMERTERYAEGDPNIEAEPDEESHALLEILLRY